MLAGGTLARSFSLVVAAANAASPIASRTSASVHVAGPTDEGFRTIDVWETRDAWKRFAERSAAVTAAWLVAAPTLRELTV